MMNLFDGSIPTGVTTYSNQTATGKPFSIEDLIELRKLMPTGPTTEQSEWARANGFVNWSGIKVTPRMMSAIRARSISSVLPRPCDDPFNGIPIVIDPDLRDCDYLTAKEAWSLSQRSVDLSTLASIDRRSNDTL